MADLPADLETIKLQLLDGIGRETRRRRHRRRAMRSTLISVGATAALSATALAAVNALGVIDLGGGARAVQVAGFPAYDVQTRKITLVGRGRIVYHITGGRARLLGCPNHPNDIYVTAEQTLDPEELRAAVEAANGIQPKTVLARVRGLLSLSNGCGDAGVEAITGQAHPAPSSLPPPLTLYGPGHSQAGITRARKGTSHRVAPAP